MSDSEVEFESADEGSKGDDGWEIETDFDLLDVESKVTETKSSILSNISKVEGIEQNVKCKKEDLKPSGPNDTTGITPTLQCGLDNLRVNNDDINSSQLIPEDSNVVQNEIKQSVSKIDTPSKIFILNFYV